MARLLKRPCAADTKLYYAGASDSTTIPVHNALITARSQVLAGMISPIETNGVGSESEVIDIRIRALIYLKSKSI